MADVRALTIQAGIHKQQADADHLVVGAGVKTAAGNLVLGATGTDVQVAAGKILSAAAGSGALDFSGASGVFKTTTGAVTIGPGAVGVSGAATFSAAGTALSVTNNASVGGTLAVTGAVTVGATIDRDAAATLGIGTVNATTVTVGRSGQELRLDSNIVAGGTLSIKGNATIETGITLATAGTGNINLPNNGSARFQIEGTAVGATVTAANLSTLTSGANADALHAHVADVKIRDAGLTLFATPLAGEVGYVSADSTLARADDASEAASRFYGVYDGTAGEVIVGGTVSMRLVSGLGTPTAGSPVYLSATAGRVTTVAPQTAGKYVAPIGVLKSAAGYDNVNGSLHPVLIRVQPPVLLA